MVCASGVSDLSVLCNHHRRVWNAHHTPPTPPTPPHSLLQSGWHWFGNTLNAYKRSQRQFLPVLVWHTQICKMHGGSVGCVGLGVWARSKCLFRVVDSAATPADERLLRQSPMVLVHSAHSIQMVAAPISPVLVRHTQICKMHGVCMEAPPVVVCCFGSGTVGTAWISYTSCALWQLHGTGVLCTCVQPPATMCVRV